MPTMEDIDTLVMVIKFIREEDLETATANLEVDIISWNGALENARKTGNDEDANQLDGICKRSVKARQELIRTLSEKYSELARLRTATSTASDPDSPLIVSMKAEIQELEERSHSAMLERELASIAWNSALRYAKRSNDALDIGIADSLKTVYEDESRKYGYMMDNLSLVYLAMHAEMGQVL